MVTEVGTLLKVCRILPIHVTRIIDWLRLARTWEVQPPSSKMDTKSLLTGTITISCPRL